MATLMLPAFTRLPLDTILGMDALGYLKQMPDESAHCIVTSPPYFGVRDYAVEGQIGLERSLDGYLSKMVSVFREARRVLRNDGTFWLNIGDSYANMNRTTTTIQNVGDKRSRANGGDPYGEIKTGKRVAMRGNALGLKEKDLMFVPHRLAIALQQDGWYTRSDIVWNKTNGMPGSQIDRPTNAHEYIFLFTKSSSDQFWVHRDGTLLDGYHSQRVRPKPDYRWVNKITEEETDIEPLGWKESEDWKRINLWRSMDYYYDIEAVTTPAKEVSIARSQRARSNTHKTINGAPGQTKQGLDAPRPNLNKQNGAGNRTYTDFNTRYDPEEHETAVLRDVWSMSTAQFRGGHYATFPLELPRRCILLGCPPGGTVLDMFMGAGTTAVAAKQLGRHWTGSELNPEYVRMAKARLLEDEPESTPLFSALVAPDSDIPPQPTGQLAFWPEPEGQHFEAEIEQ